MTLAQPFAGRAMRPRRCIALLSMTEGDQEQAEKVNEAATNGPARARGGIKGGVGGRGTAVCSDHVNDHYKVGRRSVSGGLAQQGFQQIIAGRFGT